MRRVWFASVFAAALIAAVPSGATAATQIGETFVPDGDICFGHTNIQSTSPGGQYLAPSDGVITRWSFQADGAPPDLKFKVGRPAPGADITVDADFTVIGESVIETGLDPNALNSFTTRIPVLTGDMIGLFGNTAGKCHRDPGVENYITHSFQGDVPPGDTETFQAVSAQLDVSALLEPDCDKDGLGDETQDGDLSSCAGAILQTCKGQRLTIVGTNGNDEIVGTDDRDVIAALDGNDEVFGLDGDDVICGNPGRDRLLGQGGDDTERGNRGRDTLKGKSGDDNLKGNRGRDRLRGGKGQDICRGGKGNDSAKKCEVEQSI